MFNEVAKWNYDRNLIGFETGFEMKLLSEEVREGYTAIAQNDIVELLDAIADVEFVYNGTVFKFGMSSLYPSSIEPITNYVEHHLARLVSSARDMLPDIPKDKFYKLLEDVNAIVIEANNTKPNKKNKDGKNIKGSSFVEPQDKIAELVKKYTN